MYRLHDENLKVEVEDVIAAVAKQAEVEREGVINVDYELGGILCHVEVKISILTHVST